MTTPRGQARAFRTFFQSGATRNRANAPGGPARGEYQAAIHARRAALELRAGLSSLMD